MLVFSFTVHQSTDLLEDCQKLLERFNYPWEMMPLMYAILKDARADLEEASKRIDEGKRVVNEYSRMHNLNMYDGVELRNSNPHLSTDLLEDCLKLLERLKQPWVAMPLLYVILEDARADLEEASKRIDEGRRAVSEYSRMHNINMYKGAELRNSIPHQSTDLLDGCRKLLERFKYAWDMMPLIYAILKDARADLDEASRRIDEGRRLVNEYSRRHNHNKFDGFEHRNSTRKRAVNEYSQMHTYDGVEIRKSTTRQCTDLLKDCQKLLEKFKYPWEMVPLMYAILKNARGDLEEASRRIDEDPLLHLYHRIRLKFELNWMMVPLVNVIFKYAKEVPEEALKQIEEAFLEIRTWVAVETARNTYPPIPSYSSLYPCLYPPTYIPSDPIIHPAVPSILPASPPAAAHAARSPPIVTLPRST